jgi:hypothetical protein
LVPASQQSALGSTNHPLASLGHHRCDCGGDFASEPFFFGETIERQDQLLLEQAKTIAAQALRIESLVTGGKGFAYLSVSTTNAATSDSLAIVAVNAAD